MMKKLKLIRITTVPQSFKGLLKGQLRFMSDKFEVIAVSSPGEELYEVGEFEGVKVIPVEMTRTITPVKDLKAVWQLVRSFKRERPMIVHTHTPKAGLLGMLAAWIALVPVRMHTVAGMPLMEATGFKRQLLLLMERLTYACSTKVYPNSYGMGDFIKSQKLTYSNKIKILGHGTSNGIDTSIFDPELYNDQFKKELREKLGIPPADFVFVYVGRIVKDKGINELLKAFDRLSSEISDVRLLLVGKFEDDLDPIEVSTREKIVTHPGVRYIGYQTDVRPFFSISNVLAFPSYREGFPNVVLQAGAMGLPCIVTNINGCNEIVEHKKNGIIIKVKSWKDLLIAMRYMKDKQEETMSMGQDSRKIIMKRYNQQYLWEQIQLEYESLISKVNV